MTIFSKQLTNDAELCSYFSIHHHTVWIPFTTGLYSLGLMFPATDQIAVIHQLYSSMYTSLAFYLCDYLSLVLPSSFVCATDLYYFPTVLYFICTTIKVIVILNTQTFYVFNLVYIFICISSASFSI